jgi:Gas vesicle protein
MNDDRARPLAQDDVALVDLLDRALNAGVVIAGDLTLSLADIDLVDVSLRLLVGSSATVRSELAPELEGARVGLVGLERAGTRPDR